MIATAPQIPHDILEYFSPTSSYEYQAKIADRFPGDSLAARGIVSLYLELENDTEYPYRVADVAFVGRKRLPIASLVSCEILSDTRRIQLDAYLRNKNNLILDKSTNKSIGFFSYPRPEIVRQLLTGWGEDEIYS